MQNNREHQLDTFSQEEMIQQAFDETQGRLEQNRLDMIEDWERESHERFLQQEEAIQEAFDRADEAREYSVRQADLEA